MKNVSDIRFRSLADLRKFHGLSVIELAGIVGRSPATVESWESLASGRKCPMSLHKVDELVEKRLEKGLLPPSNNLLFSTLPLSVAPALMQLDVDQFLRSFDIKESFWKKYCSSRKEIPIALKEIIEVAIRNAINCTVVQQSDAQVIPFPNRRVSNG